MRFRIDSIPVRLESVDIDRDGRSDETETIKSHKEQGVLQFKESSELGEALEQQNRDIENQQRLSSVDFLSRLNPYSVSPVSAVEFISANGVISRDARLITRIFKRNIVSDGGKGRQEFVDVVVGKKESDIRKAGIQNLTGQPQQVR